MDLYATAIMASLCTASLSSFSQCCRAVLSLCTIRSRLFFAPTEGEWPNTEQERESSVGTDSSPCVLQGT